jgi:hypothetical protein
MRKLLEQCPSCGGPLVITECKCADCQLQLRAEFWPGQFSALSEDQLTFIRVFLRARGNLSEVEKVMGVSYPTIRNKLDEVNQALDRAEAASASAQGAHAGATQTSADPAAEARQAILQQVAAGDLSATEALDKLQKLHGGK